MTLDGAAAASVGALDTQRGRTVWLTGLPSAGKSTLARALEKRLVDAGRAVEVLDGDVVRTNLTKDLGYTKADRDTNVRRIGFVAQLLARHGVTVICPVISPYRAIRNEIRAGHEADGTEFFEVHVATPVEVCAERDVKGLYARQRAGEISGLTGIDDPYEPPEHPELVVEAHAQSVDESADAIWAALTKMEMA